MKFETIRFAPSFINPIIPVPPPPPMSPDESID